MFSINPGKTSKYNNPFLIFNRIIYLLPVYIRLRLVINVILSILVGLIDAISIAVLLSFMLVLTSQNNISIENNMIFSRLENLGLLSNNEQSNYIFIMYIVLLIVNILGGIIKTYNIRISIDNSAIIGTDLSIKAFSNILNRSYEDFSKIKTSKDLSILLGQMNNSVGWISSFLLLPSAFASVIFILIELYRVDKTITSAGVSLFVFIYILISKLIGKTISQNSKKITTSNVLYIESITEALNSIKHLIITYSQPIYINIFKKQVRIFRKLRADNDFYGKFPRYAIEPFAIIIISTIAVYLYFNTSSLSVSISQLSAFAFGSQKLLPALQQIYISWSRITSKSVPIKNVLLEIKQKQTNFKIISDEEKDIKEFKKLELKSVDFSYPGSELKILNQFNFEAKSGDLIGLIGSTGSGKSTIIDICLGLLKPKKGSVIVDGKDINSSLNPENIHKWNMQLSYVQQDVKLIDSSIKENILIGAKSLKNQEERIRSACEIACIDGFIDSLPNGIDTLVGENGVLLSGGQKQRISIARSIFNSPQVLILDEATSALDETTERKVITQLFKTDNIKTIIMVTHRKSILKFCNKVYEI